MNMTAKPVSPTENGNTGSRVACQSLQKISLHSSKDSIAEARYFRYHVPGKEPSYALLSIFRARVHEKGDDQTVQALCMY
jgi:hypothetical protein